MTLSPGMLNTLIALIYESIVVISFLVILLIIIHHYLTHPSTIVKLLIVIFSFYFLGSVFSMSAKAIYWHFQVNFYYEIDPAHPYFVFFKYICKYRLSFSALLMSNIFLYRLKLKIFAAKRNLIEQTMMAILSIISIIIVIFYTQTDLSDIVAFGLMLTTTLFTYIPFIRSTYQLSQMLEESNKAYKRGLYSLILMSIFFIFIALSMLFDRMLMILLASDGYTIFYYLGWASCVFGTISAYFGYIKPASIVETPKSEQIPTPAETHESVPATTSPQKNLALTCPICKKKLIIDLKQEERDLISNNFFTGITTISIPVTPTCEHGFIVSVDKNFNIRGYQVPDYVHDGKDTTAEAD